MRLDLKSPAIDAALASSPAHLLPVLSAVRDKQAAMMFVGQDSGAFTLPRSAKLAATVLIGDDMHASMGPDGFHMPSIRRLIRACRAFAVVSSEADADLYASMAAVAVGGRHALIVETRLTHEFQWAALIQKLAPRQPLIISTVKGGRA